ncbi:MAG TPA: TIGR03067 domain-containing protein [Gemmata sp.]|nr:TIGR03067 domain-containing protein [Gemmata sp.]
MNSLSIVASFKAMALTALAFVFGAGIAIPADDKEAKSLNGTWQVVSQSTNGKEDAIPKDGGDMVTLNDGKYTIKEGDKDICKGTFKLDSTKTPMSIDKTMSEGDDKGKTALGIYQLTGDEVKVSWSRAGETDRPAGFDAKSYRVTTLKRIKS